MMIDYNVSDHWLENDPDWLKSLTSSLDRRHGDSTVIPLTVIVNEIIEWIEFASGVDAWKKKANRDSLQLDLEESISALGCNLRKYIESSLDVFCKAFSELTSQTKLLSKPPGMRNEKVWQDALREAKKLLEMLDSTEAVRANWDDLVEISKNQILAGREYRPVAELLFDQLTRRGLDSSQIFYGLVSIIAFGRDPSCRRDDNKKMGLDERGARARAYVGRSKSEEQVVVWLSYKGRINLDLDLGDVTFMDAHWVVPNAEPDGFDFKYKKELQEIKAGKRVFKVARLVDEKSDVDLLVRVDLGVTTVADALSRALKKVDTILDISIYSTGGIRPRFVQYVILSSGKLRSVSGVFDPQGGSIPNDYHGANITSEAIKRYGSSISKAFAREELPKFLASAIEIQLMADSPFSRERILRKPSKEDISNIIPLADRTVQYIAGYMSRDPKEVTEKLAKRWSHMRWLTDLRNAVGMCLLGGGDREDLCDELKREFYSTDDRKPWVLVLFDRMKDLLSLCRLEHERAWIARMFKSACDSALYKEIISEYEADRRVLDLRRCRVRNSLVHGNPIDFMTIKSVQDYAEFLSHTALDLALKAYFDGSDPALKLDEKTDEFRAMEKGKDIVSYWKARISATASTNG
ncbi:hypothetical protein [Propionibacterium acidifaciens]